MFWEVLFIILNVQNLLDACSHDVGLCSTQYYIKSGAAYSNHYVLKSYYTSSQTSCRAFFSHPNTTFLMYVWY